MHVVQFCTKTKSYTIFFTLNIKDEEYNIHDTQSEMEIISEEKFLEIISEVSARYNFTIHGFVLMNNHYHLLLENQRENLSAGLRQINSTYAKYYNKKYKRSGHFWQGRFKSWYT